MKNTFLNFSIDRLYKKSDLDSSMGIWTLILIVIALFVVFQFRTPLLLIPAIRDAEINKLVDETVKNQAIDIQHLWQLRDKLGAKVTYNPQYLEPHSIFQFKEIPAKEVQLFQYNGRGVISTEYLTPPFGEIREPIIFPGDQVILKQGLAIYLDSSNHKLYIRSEHSFDSMVKNNGMIDFRELKQDLSNKVWVIETVFDVSPHFKLNEL